MKTNSKNIILIVFFMLAIVIIGFFPLRKATMIWPYPSSNFPPREEGERIPVDEVPVKEIYPIITDDETGEYEELTFPDNTLDTSDWQTYRNEEFGFEVRYPRGWDVLENTKQQMLKRDPSVTFEPSYQGQIILDPHSDPYSFVYFNIYFESVDRVVEKIEWRLFKDPGPLPRRTGRINNAKSIYYIRPDTQEILLSPLFLGNEEIAYQIDTSLSGFPGVFEHIILSFKLIK